MRDPIALAVGMALLVIAGLIVGATKFAGVGLIVGGVLAVCGFIALVSRDAGFEEEIDGLLHQHAVDTRRQA